MTYIDEILEKQTDLNKTAVIDGNRELTYAELLESSYLLATTLISYGAKGNDSIVIYLEKSIEMVISIFGILKSGCAYVPVDYDLPLEKIEYIISCSKPFFIITDVGGVEKLQSGKIDKHQLYLVLNRDGGSGCDNLNQQDSGVFYWTEMCKSEARLGCLKDLTRSPNDISYMLFTSGSTGKPKGVMIRHNSLKAFADAAIEFMGYTEDMRMLSISPFHFDVSIPDIFCTLKVGGTIVLMKKFFMPNDILEALKKYEITDVIMVSSIFKLLSSRYSNLYEYTFSKLKTIWYGGETCPIQVIKDLQRAFVDATFVHGYGQTETTFCATVYRVYNIDDNVYGSCPVGKPLATVETYALNDNNAIIGPGEIGEMHIGGIQVMLGYCNDQAKTDECLVNIPGVKEKVYKTGDYVTLNEEGNYIFLGRKDDMIKCSGRMVHLNEIERVLLSCAHVKDAFVLPYVDDLYLTKMKAFVIPYDDGLPSKNELVEHIQKTLPKYMIPHDIVVVYEDQLPKSSTGKVDRNRLLSMDF